MAGANPCAQSRATTVETLENSAKMMGMKYIRVLPAELSHPNTASGIDGAETKVSATEPPHSIECLNPADYHGLPNKSAHAHEFGAQQSAQQRSGVCEHCGRSYSRKNPGRFCSHTCAHKAKTGKPLAGFITPESEREERIRANGLINKRLKLGWFVKPTACMKCGAAKRLDSHHTDYSKPDHVFWLCRSCHMLSHREADFLKGIKPFVCDEKTKRWERSAPSPAPANGGGAACQ